MEKEYIQQLDLFSGSYRSLETLKQLVMELHWTGGMNDDGTLQYTEYHLDFYKDLAFIVEYRDETDSNEKIIDNCVELKQIDNNLYKIIKIDGKALGDISVDNPNNLAKQKELIASLEKGEVFKK